MADIETPTRLAVLEDRVSRYDQASSKTTEVLTELTTALARMQAMIEATARDMDTLRRDLKATQAERLHARIEALEAAAVADRTTADKNVERIMDAIHTLSDSFVAYKVEQAKLRTEDAEDEAAEDRARADKMEQEAADNRAAVRKVWDFLLRWTPLLVAGGAGGAAVGAGDTFSELVKMVVQ